MPFLLCYFALINLTTFIFRWIDKWKAVQQKWRISEKTLLLFCALGGFVWAILAMGVWRHKTIKTKFLVRFYLIVFLRAALWVALYLLFGK